jgi:hypothetical protein
MPVQRTELRDELRVLIAAGRELTPEHDQVLAEAFLDRVAGRLTPPAQDRSPLALRATPKRLLGAVILGLACLGTVSIATSHVRTTSPAPIQAVPPSDGRS